MFDKAGSTAMKEILQQDIDELLGIDRPQSIPSIEEWKASHMGYYKRMDINRLEQIARDAMDEERIHRFPPTISGRILHADADGFSYKACDLEHSYGENVTALKELIHIWRRLAGAEYIVNHLTLGLKGREDIARVQKYQGGRNKTDIAKNDRVNDLRIWMSDYTEINVWPKNNYNQEADDSLTQSMYLSIENGGNDDVLFSPDKDLWMTPGKHLNKDTFEIEEFPLGYGNCHTILDAAGKKKLRGKGTSWFWHQLLMGDNADDIPGLPYLSKDLWIKYAPTKAFVDVNRKIASGRMPSGKTTTLAQKSAALSKFNKMYSEAQPKQIGQILANRYLSSCMTDHAAYLRCKEAYRQWYGEKVYFYSWNNVLYDNLTWKDMLLEQARLLWMRRTPGEDVKDWLDSLENK